MTEYMQTHREQDGRVEAPLVTPEARGEGEVALLVVDPRLGLGAGAVAVDGRLVAEQLHLCGETMHD